MKKMFLKLLENLKKIKKLYFNGFGQLKYYATGDKFRFSRAHNGTIRRWLFIYLFFVR